ncbi:28S ribosomal protein S5, mitochondrial-like [Stegodyphus dumicola]|uniref:28S ribosomal protein S5, mitochondrial-like n=1 Tax=Stegodyphus dumicola TaxID=202533 RepID=UPI0015ACC7E7|nr:28S ribosomal protein S5, mitochondrial-like [Stegodyphus dumicola]
MAVSRVAVLNLCKQYSKLIVSDTRTSLRADKLHVTLQYNKFSPLNWNIWRYSHTFLSRVTAEQLWKGVTSVSPAGRKKGRGKSRKVPRDLNRGQVIGFGKKNMLWPGLNAPVIQGREVLKQQELPPDEERQKRILELRDKFSKRKSYKLHPLERGWSGTKLGGRSLGPPDPVGEETFEGFDSRVLEFKTVMHMSGQRGRVRNFSAFVVVGNKKGLAGYGLARSVNASTAANAAKNKAAHVLRYIELDNNTVIHDFCGEFGAVRVFVEKRPEGNFF